MTVTFFGHRDVDKGIVTSLYHVLNDLICNKGADLFYVGNHGNFDALVLSVLKDLKKHYAHIRYIVVLAYVPQATQDFKGADTLLPCTLINALPRFAIAEESRTHKAWVGKNGL